ncbi:hypothetical protein SAMN05216371_0379 [Streptomyces sp. TLI_053]|uniref:hypothetical protein n=1 Tax=Streptomyces sp. TLI_053 TaxID=1855352 RepID=UPI00087CE6D4|nr:hypothetical protein [Streptomyces sp. TLI_053]SDS66935.1 hypothetical protein SAMN05216371_0379 [Streptomyces sp. TLI_053]
MFKSGKAQEEPVIVVRDSRQVEADLRRALETAEAGERAGLERALRIVMETVSAPDAGVRRRWVREVLHASGADVRDQVGAVKALRTARPGLSLAAAYQLVREAGE